MTLGQIISEFRNKHSMSMDKFSELSGLSKGYISMLENNKNPRTGKPIIPSLDMYNNVAKAINVSLDILLDMSSLDHILIMFFTKQFLKQIIPRTLFAAYIRPEKYRKQYGDIEFSLSSQVMAVKAVPGFAKRESNKQTLCSFLGFEGIRLKGVLETVHNVDRFIPVVAFPSGAPQWYNTTIWNSMDTLQSECKESAVLKCFSESVFEVIELLRDNITPDEKLVLAPLGTRPHSMACAIFACEHPNTLIVYDHVVEHDHRAIGISEITIYHLSTFLKTVN